MAGRHIIRYMAMANSMRIRLLGGGILLLATCAGILVMLRACDKASPQEPLISAVETTYNPQETADESSHIIALFPNCAPAYHNRGLSYRLLGYYSKSIDDLTQAIKLQPYDNYIPYTYLQRGIAYAQLGKLGNALRDLDEAIFRHPSMGRAYYTRGEVLLAQGKADEAMADYMRARSHGVVHTLFLRSSLQILRIYAAKGELERALDEVYELQEMYPDAPEVYSAGGSILLQKRRFVGAINSYLYKLYFEMRGGWSYKHELVPNEAYMYEPQTITRIWRWIWCLDAIYTCRLINAISPM